MRYKQRFRHAVVSPGAFQRLHHRRSAYRMAHQTTRRCQQNAMRWLCLWYRRKGSF